MIKILTTSWNAEKYIDLCIESILFQNYQDYKVFILDDISTDRTVDIIKEKITRDDRFHLIENKEKKFQLKNYDDILSNKELVDDDDIIVELDGDDWFYHDGVLSIVNEAYRNNKELLIANGKFAYINGHIGFSDHVNISSLLTAPFRFSHLRTWKCSLWRQVDKKHFIDPNSPTGSYFKAAGDMAFAFPMLKIAGQHRYEHIPEVLLVYNDSNPYNEHKDKSAGGGRQEQLKADAAIRALNTKV
jgi:glycosyltransferase involved in cell wall biosynthesis